MRQEGTTEAGECWTLNRKDTQLLSKTEMCMLPLIQDVSLTEHQTNVSIRKKAGVLDLPSHLIKRRLH